MIHVVITSPICVVKENFLLIILGNYSPLVPHKGLQLQNEINDNKLSCVCFWQINCLYLDCPLGDFKWRASLVASEAAGVLFYFFRTLKILHV